jgi:response regulator RpfG family c-di-GMP phosphodiesterase
VARCPSFIGNEGPAKETFVVENADFAKASNAIACVFDVSLNPVPTLGSAVEESGSAIVLVVDDEPGVRAALGRALEAGGYPVLLAASADEALGILQDKPVHVIITDHHMPGMSGIDLLKLVRVRYPRVVRILLTADKEPETPVRSINESEVYRFIRKPWNNADVRTIVSLAFEIARLEQENRHLGEIARTKRAPPGDPADLESELLQLAEDEIEGKR